MWITYIKRKGKCDEVPTSVFPTFPSSTVKNADPTPQPAAKPFSIRLKGWGEEVKAKGQEKRFVGDKTQLYFGVLMNIP